MEKRGIELCEVVIRMEMVNGEWSMVSRIPPCDFHGITP